MLKPKKIIRMERNVLAIIEKGHPDRPMTFKSRYDSGEISPLSWIEIQHESKLQSDEFGNCIAHLVRWGFIRSAPVRAGFIGRLLGKEDTYYFWATDLGKKFLSEYPSASIPEKIELPNKDLMMAEDIHEAIRIFENSFTNVPYKTQEEIQWATNMLDQDIKNEIKIAACELELMWGKFRDQFGHSGPARNQKECDLRNPVVKKTSVRLIRALDEQLRRRGFPPSEKPDAWADYYNNGDVGLEPAPWES